MRFIYVFVFALLLGACVTAPLQPTTPTASIPSIIIVEENPYRPQSTDASLKLAGAIVNNTSSGRTL
jgi:starvation-inducible outer membrane lipoprotein